MKWEIPSFRFPDFLLDNCICCLSDVQKRRLEKTGGYNPEMTHGWEDFDFWLSLIESGAQVVQIPETLFITDAVR